MRGRIFDWDLFPRSLGFWAIHIGLGSIPSFVTGLEFLREEGAQDQWMALVCGVASLIVLYALLSSRCPIVGAAQGTFQQAFRVAVYIRLVISIVGICFVLIPGNMSGHPDIWPGFLSVMIVAFVVGGNLNTSFLAIWATVWVEAFIITGCIGLVALALAFVRAWLRRGR